MEVSLDYIIYRYPESMYESSLKLLILKYFERQKLRLTR